MFRSNNKSSGTRGRFTARARLAIVAGGVVVASTAFVAIGSSVASASPSPRAFGGSNLSTVYTETNQVAGNSVIAYRAQPGGALTPIATVPTGGTGTGAGTGSQGGVTLGDNDQILAVVNAGSNSVSVFSVGRSGSLRLIETAGSGGVEPISVTVNGLWVYVLNAGSATAPGNIAGINIGFAPFFNKPLVVQSLNAAASSPEQISFTPNGRDLLVAEKGSNTIDVFPVGPFGFAGPAVTNTVPAGTGPYGFGFSANGDAVVSDAGLGALSSFSVNPNGTLTAISTAIPDGQLAPCWVALTPDGREAFTANAHSGTVSAYSVASNGTLTLLSPTIAASPGVGDTDLAVAGNSTLYISDQPNLDASTINASGTLNASTPVVTGDLAGAFGLAATTPFGF